MNSEMPAKKAPAIERRLTTGNLWTIAVMVAGIIGGTGYQHFMPSEAAQKATEASEQAVAKSAVVEATVATHTLELSGIQNSIGNLSSDVAVLKAQGDVVKDTLNKQSDKLDDLLKAVYRSQGREYAPKPN